MNVEEFRADLRNTVYARAAVDQDYTSVAFITEVAEKLAEAEEVENLDILSFEGTGSKKRRLAVNGFDLNDSDNSIALAVLEFGDSPDIQTLGATEAKRAFSGLESFLEDSVSGDFFEGREESTPEFQLAMDLKQRGRNVTRYRLYLITDMEMSGRAKAFPSKEVNRVPVDFHIWDIQRLFQVNQSAQGREELTIDLQDWLEGGVPALQVSDTANEFTTYLAAMPAHVVAELYGRYGSRLLEGNVRSYLSNRGKVNQGIRTTILREPAHFLAYNNGITATATGIRRDERTGKLLEITDLQIVNGGQTTASLFYVSRDQRPKPDLTDVYVQMKLVVVDAENALEMIPQISRFANSQNRVSEADFFSNSPFHVRLEELSRRLLVPARAGINYQTKWFYERTRGQYQNEKNKLGAADQKKFEAQYPRPQMITKTDAAKYEVSWLMQPHQVSGGAQKNFVAFANAIASKWNTADQQFNELYFKHLVAKAILFNRVRYLVAHSDWYDKGYLANIVSYTLAKLAYEVGRQSRGGAFDLDRIWSEQQITHSTATECLNIAELVLGALTDDRRPLKNVTEWAKKSECWELVKSIRYALSDDFLSELEDRSEMVEKRREAVATRKIDSGIEAQTKALAIPADRWDEIRTFCSENRLASPTDLSILDLMTGRKSGFPSEKQSTRLLQLLSKAEGHGLSV